MKKELILFIVFIATFLFIVLGYWLTEIYDWPGWVRGIFSFAALFSFTEIIPRLGPEKRETPLARLLRLSRREKTVFLIVAPLTCIVIVLLGTSFASPVLSLLSMVASLVVGWVICRVVGGPRLGHFLLTGGLRDPAAPQVKSQAPKHKNNRR